MSVSFQLPRFKLCIVALCPRPLTGATTRASMARCAKIGFLISLDAQAAAAFSQSEPNPRDELCHVKVQGWSLAALWTTQGTPGPRTNACALGNRPWRPAELCCAARKGPVGRA